MKNQETFFLFLRILPFSKRTTYRFLCVYAFRLLFVFEFTLTFFFLTSTLFSSPSQKIYFAKEPTIFLYAVPDFKSKIIREFTFGEILYPDSDPLEKESTHWIPVKDTNSIFGYVKRSEVINCRESEYFKILMNEVDRNLLIPTLDYRSRKNTVERMRTLRDSLHWTGEEFLLIQSKLGLTFSYLLIRYRDLNLSERNQELGYIRSFKELVREDTKGISLNTNYFWNLAFANPNFKESDYAAYLGVRLTPRNDCKGLMECHFQNWRDRELKYLKNFPDGSYAEHFTKLVLDELETLGSQEKLVCPKDSKKILQNFQEDSSNFSSSLRRRSTKLLQKISQKCHLGN